MTISEYLEYSHTSIDEFGHLVNVTGSYIRMIIGKKRKPSYDLAMKIHTVTEGKVSMTQWYKNPYVPHVIQYTDKG